MSSMLSAKQWEPVIPDYKNPRAKALQDEARELYDRAERAKTDDEKTILRARARAKEREADKIEREDR